MSKFDKICKNYVQQLDERSTDTARLSDRVDPSAAVVARGAANRFGKYQNSDVQPFFQELIKDLLSREDKNITYADASVAIKNMLTRSQDRGGMGMAGSFADKWTQHLASSLFNLLTSVNSAVKDPSSDPKEAEAAAEAEETINTAPETSEDQETSDTEEEPEEKTSEEKPQEPEFPEDEEISDYWTKKIFEYIKDGGETPTTEKEVETYIMRKAAAVRDEDSVNLDSSLKNLLSKGFLKKEGDGYVAIEKEVKQKEGDELPELGAEDEDVFRAGQERAYSDLERGMNSGRTSIPTFENFDMMAAYVDIFRSKSRG